MGRYEPTQVVRERRPRSFNLLCRIPPQLVHDFDCLTDSRSAEGVATAQEASIGVDGDPATEVGFALLDEEAALALFAKSQILVFDNLRNGETIVGLSHIQLTGFDFRGVVGLFCGYL